MKFLTICELRGQTPALRARLARAKEIVVTVSGKPFALLTPLNAETLEEEILAVRRARARMAVDKIRVGAREKGLDHLRTRDIEAVIAKARGQRASRRSS